MATDVLMNNSPTPHCSRDISQATPNTRPNASGVQPHNASGSPTTPEELVDRLLKPAKPPLGEAERQKVVETLEKMLQPQFQMSLRTRRRCFRGLVKTCGEHGILPSSYIIPESEIKKQGDSHIASGGFSEVLRGTYKGESPVAIKVIRLYDIYTLNIQGTKGIKEVKKNFCREVITWKRLSHPNVLELIGVMMDDKEYIMVTPLMKNGTIVDFLKKNVEANPLKLLEDAVQGLQYLHSIELAHGDLKGANILISDDCRACLADVGLTRVAGDMVSAATSQTSTSSGANTRRWCPPELLDPDRFKSKRGGPTKKADMYSMGMTIYEILTDSIPFSAHNDNVAILCILEGVRPKTPIFAATRGYTEELWEMTTSCWKEDPSDRPTVDDVLAVLKGAAEKWKPKHGALATPSPRDGWSSTLTEGPDSGTQATPDEEVDQILDRAKSPLEEAEVWDVLETLETMLESHDQMDPRTRTRCFQALVEICVEYDVLPDSYIIPDPKFQKLGGSPVSSDGVSEVWPGVDEEDNSIAIRVIHYRDAGDVREIKKNFFREVVAWKRLSHPNILELIGVTMGDEDYTMVSPWMDNIVEFLGRNAETNPLKLLQDAACGLQYLHNMDHVHGDLRGANILISEDGCARLADPAATSRRPTSGGGKITRWYPPELQDMEKSESQRGDPTKESDIYSMSMTIYEVLTDRLPFHEHSDTVAMVYILKGERPKKPMFDITRGYTNELWELTTSCWEGDPSDRPTADYVFSVLRDAAEQWTPEHRKFDTLFLEDDRSSTPLGERLESPIVPECKDGPITTTTSASHNPSQPAVTESPATAPTPTPPVPAPSITENGTPPTYTPVPSLKEEEIEPTPVDTLKEKRLKPVLATLGVEPVPVDPLKEEPGSDATPSKGEVKPMLISPSKEQKPVEQRASEHGEVDNPSLEEDRSSTPLGERLESPTVPKCKNGPITTTSASHNPSQSAVTVSPVTALVPTPPAPAPSITENGTPPTCTPVPSLKEEEIEHTPVDPLKKKGLKPVPATSKVKPVPVGRLGGEPGSDPAFLEGEVKPVLVSPSEEQGPEYTPAASEQNTKPVPVNPPKEKEFGSTLAPSKEEMKPAPSKGEEPERTIVTPKEETSKEKAPLEPTREQAKPSPASHPQVKARALTHGGVR